MKRQRPTAIIAVECARRSIIWRIRREIETDQCGIPGCGVAASAPKNQASFLLEAGVRRRLVVQMSYQED